MCAKDNIRVNEHFSWIYEMRVFGELKREVWVCAPAKDIIRVNEHFSWVYQMRVFDELKPAVLVCAQNILYVLMNISLGYIQFAFSAN